MAPDAVIPYARRNDWKARISRDGDTVVKDYRGVRYPHLVLGKLFLDDEETALRRLAGVRGVPRFLGRPNPLAIRIEAVPGTPVEKMRKRERVSEAFLEDLRRVFSEMHERGVAHGDAHMKNILAAGDAAFVIDFATAWVRGRFPLLDPVVFPRLARLDDLRVFKVEDAFFHRGEPPRMFFLYRLLKRVNRKKKRRYRHET
ncbi:MAG: hypothetical protein MUE73_03990 [Planctomycetes bacterium]|jgi:hypothetical protein|nr:hypothetical protein [Planctomycetota bacterium]